MKFMERMRLRARTRTVEHWLEARRYCSVQHDFDIADGPGASVRGDLNDSLEALVTWNSGAADPVTSFARMRVVNTTDGVVKRRNAANSAWIIESTDDETLVVSRSSNTILDVSDIGKTFVATAGYTQTFDAAATLTGSWWCRYRIESGATIVFDPNSTENIDGAATKSVVGPQSGFLVCNGSALFTIGFTGGAAAASQAEMEAASSNTVLSTPLSAKWAPSAAKAWVRFNGTGTIAIVASYNVASLTDNGTGDYTVNLTTAFSSSTAYAVIADANDGGYNRIGHAIPINASSFKVLVEVPTVGTGTDVSNINAFAFGDQ